MNTSTSGTTKNYRVLLVGDEDNSARLILNTLHKVGLECRYAVGAAAGLSAFRENNIHLVLLDLSTPTAETLCARIRENSTKPLLMTTAATDHQVPLIGLKVGADDYLLKPLDPPMLIARVFALLRRVYVYGGDESHVAKAPPSYSDQGSRLPEGWATCEACNYMGPSPRFEGRSRHGQSVMVCPHCRVPAAVTYAVS
ncbi:MAG: response regulator [Abitibacteriaceae bacterium]|nr:response regulator [Abditibacteriaceae bacterium]